MTIKKRKKQKPETVKVGHAVVKIYPHRKNIPGRKEPYVTWQVADFTSGDRKFRTFADHDAARREAERLAGLISAGEAEAAKLSNRDAEIYLIAKDKVAPTGDSLLVVAERYFEAVKILGGDGSHIIEAAQAFAKRRKHSNATVAQVVEKMLEAKKGRRQQRTLDDLRNRLAKFTESFQCPIASITHSEIQAWLDGLKTSERTKINYRAKLNTLFEWARKRGHVPDNPVEDTERPDANDGEIQIYTPAELNRLIAAAHKDFLPYLVIGAFAGLRPSEILRLEWEKVHLALGFIEVSAKKRNTPTRRTVPIQPNLAAWLADYVEKKGKVWTGTEFQLYGVQRECHEATRVEADPEKEIAALEPVPRKQDGLRHSFCSYRLAITKNDSQVAIEAGNTPNTIHSHYKQLVHEQDANIWFSISPEKPANVLPIAVAQKA